MKIITLERHTDDIVDLLTQASVIADSAVVVNGRPLFLPDFADDWQARVYLAYRISRLGKSVKNKFASRYYDAVALALHIAPRPIDDFISILPFADNSIALSPFATIPADGGVSLPSLRFESLTFQLVPEAINMAIEQITRYATIRNGDLVLVEYRELSLPVIPGTEFHGNIAGSPFSIRIR